jgi:predicted cupin superfamily sugar epimerase
MEIEDLIQKLDLKPHPEGGFFRETYRSTDSIASSGLPERFGGDRSLATAIYYVLTPDSFSALHRLDADEVYHFYLGDPVEMLLLRHDGDANKIVLGPDIVAEQQVQAVVPHGWWQGSRLLPGGKFALLGCTMGPGFDFKGFELGKRAVLSAAYPNASADIELLTRE